MQTFWILALLFSDVITSNSDYSIAKNVFYSHLLVRTSDQIHSRQGLSLMQCIHSCLGYENCTAGRYQAWNEKSPRNCLLYKDGIIIDTMELQGIQSDGSVSFHLQKKRTEEEWGQLKAWEDCQQASYASTLNAGKVVSIKNIGQHYCKFNIPNCGDGGWTLLMKMNGALYTFQYFSKLWTESSTLNDKLALRDVENSPTEGKFQAYNELPIKELCVGMSVRSVQRWIKISKTASSLLSVIKTGQRQTTYFGRKSWKSLIIGSSMQRRCNLEGFNIVLPKIRTRIGLLSNNENGCGTPDSVIGFGVYYTSLCSKRTRRISCGNSAYCIPDNGDKNIPSIGYIYAR